MFWTNLQLFIDFFGTHSIYIHVHKSSSLKEHFKSHVYHVPVCEEVSFALVFGSLSYLFYVGLVHYLTITDWEYQKTMTLQIFIISFNWLDSHSNSHKSIETNFGWCSELLQKFKQYNFFTPCKTSINLPLKLKIIQFLLLYLQHKHHIRQIL